MNKSREVQQDAEAAIRRILDEAGGFGALTRQVELPAEPGCDLVLRAASAGAEILIAVEAKARITPQTAISLCERMRELPHDVIPVVYAPVISPRVAEIVEQHGIGFVDQAGNCRLRSARHGLLIDRRGYKSAVRAPQRVADPFAPKSSRIVRALLSQPDKGWMVQELARDADVDVAVGLVSKVKRALVEEGYAIEHNRLLYLRDPVGLLENWAREYHGPVQQIPMYFRSDVEAAEQAVVDCCRDNSIPCALAGFSAAWRLAPEVRHGVGAVYIDDRAFSDEMLSQFSRYQGGKHVETGANLLLWRPFDRSVLAGSETSTPAEMPITSAIQTFLDLKRLAGRGEEAAAAVYESHLANELQQAAQRVEEMRHAEL